MRTLGIVLLLTAALFAAACGDPPPSDSLEALMDQLPGLEAEDMNPILERIGRLGRSDPTVIPRLIEGLRVERADPFMNTVRFTVELPAADVSVSQRSSILRTVASILARRLAAYGYVSGTFSQQAAEGVVVLRIPRPFVGADGGEASVLVEREKQFLAVLISRLTQTGGYELLVEVTPPEEGAEPPSLWAGSRGSFDRFVESEAARLEAAVKAGRAYEPLRPDYRISFTRPAAPEEAPGLVLLARAPEPAARFGSADFRLRGGQDRASGTLLLALEVNEERRDELARWSGTHSGRRVAFVLNGRTEVLLTVKEPIKQHLMLPLGPEKDPRVRGWLEGMLAAIGPGALPYPVRGEEDTSLPLSTVTPLMQALVAVGQPAAEALVELRAEGGTLGARAQRILEQIGRRHTTGGDRPPRK